MIKIQVNKYEGGGKNFKVELDPFLKPIFVKSNNLKVRFSRIDPDDFWEHNISPGVWVTYNSGMNDIVNIQLIQNDVLIYEHKYDFLLYGTELEQYLNLFCKFNKNTKGIVVGSHDGTFGHWVYSVLDNETSAIIIEGSEEQFTKLTKTYGDLENCTLLNEVISKDGNPVTWYKGGQGFTDSIISEVPSKFMRLEEIYSEVKETKTLNEVIENYHYQNYDWLHTDVEGYDAQLIMSLSYFPKLIIFENGHIKENSDYNELCTFLEERGYSITDFGNDTLAIKK